MPSDNYGSMYVNSEGRKWTYGASIFAYAGYAGATDVFALTGAAGKLIKIAGIHLNADATASSLVPFQMFKRTTLNTGGTPTTVAIAKYDSTNPTPSASVVTYGAAPTISAGGIAYWPDILFCPSASTPTVQTEFPSNNVAAQYMTLRGANEQICLNFGGASGSVGATLPAGFAGYFELRWTEEDIPAI